MRVDGLDVAAEVAAGDVPRARERCREAVRWVAQRTHAAKETSSE